MRDILNNPQDLTNNTASQLIGLDISEAKERLGHWWVLESQNIFSHGGEYVFSRAGVGKIHISTNTKNIVVQTPTSAIWGDERKKKIIVGRPINGISLNGDEYLLDDKNEVLEFDSEHDAKKFLIENGIDFNDLDHFNYVEKD